MLFSDVDSVMDSSITLSADGIDRRISLWIQWCCIFCADTIGQSVAQLAVTRSSLVIELCLGFSI